MRGVGFEPTKGLTQQVSHHHLSKLKKTCLELRLFLPPLTRLGDPRIKKNFDLRNLINFFQFLLLTVQFVILSLLNLFEVLTTLQKFQEEHKEIQ